MTVDWFILNSMLQQIIVLLIVLAAAFYICRMLWSTLFGAGGCHNCSSNHTSGPKARAKAARLPQHLIQVQTAPKNHGETNGTDTPH